MEKYQWKSDLYGDKAPSDSEDNAMDLFSDLESEHSKKEPGKQNRQPKQQTPVNPAQQPKQQAKQQAPAKPAQQPKQEAQAKPAQPSKQLAQARPAQPSKQQAPAKPAQQPKQEAAAKPVQPIKQQAPAKPEPAVRSAVREPEEVSSPEKEEESRERSGKRRLYRNLAIAGVLVLALISVAVLVHYQQQKKKNREAAESSSEDASSQAPESSLEEVSYESEELFGVIESVDHRSGLVSVYNAETGSTTEFDLNASGTLNDEYGTEISIGALAPGQIVNVQYNGTNEQVELFRLSSKASQLENVYGAEYSDGSLTISGDTYEIDEHLVCLYHGAPFEISELTAQDVITANVLDGHIYSIFVTGLTGQIKLENTEKFVGGKVSFRSESGIQTEEKNVTSSMDPIRVPEGVNTMTITLDQTNVFSGKVFVLGGETQPYRLPDETERKGKVTVVTSPSGASISIDGASYAPGETIELTYGQHTMTVSAAGYEDAVKTINIGQPYQRVSVNLTSSSTSVSISSAAEGSAVYIDGIYQGTAPLMVQLSPGSYTITLITPGYEDSSMWVTIASGELEKVIYFSDLIPIPEPEPEPESSEPEESSEESSSEESSSEESSSEESSSEESSSEESSTEESSEEESSAEESSSEESSEEESSAEESSIEESSEGESSAEESSIEESSEEESSVEESSTEESSYEESSYEESSYEESSYEESSYEESSYEESPAESESTYEEEVPSESTDENEGTE